MQKTTIPCRDGLLYLVRWRIVQTPWFAVYLHDIFEPDEGRDPHDHPWTFWSLVLRGGYEETIWDRPNSIYWDENVVRPLYPGELYEREVTPYRRRWLPFSLHRMDRGQAHRIDTIRPGTKTLVFTGRRAGGWGFYTPEGFVRWQDYHHEVST